MQKSILITLTITAVLLLSACKTADPAAGVTFLEALSEGDLEAADQQVCASQQGKLSEKVLRGSKTPPRGTDVMGMKSPGMSGIDCETTGSDEITCSFWSPQLQCKGNLLSGETVTCSSWKNQGEQKNISFTIEGHKICDYDWQ